MKENTEAGEEDETGSARPLFLCRDANSCCCFVCCFFFAHFTCWFQTGWDCSAADVGVVAR